MPIIRPGMLVKGSGGPSIKFTHHHYVTSDTLIHDAVTCYLGFGYVSLF